MLMYKNISIKTKKAMRIKAFIKKHIVKSEK